MAVQSTGTGNIKLGSEAQLAYAFETAPGTLQSSPSWQNFLVTDQGDFGGTVESYTPSEISASRQRELGEVVGLTASASFDMLIRQNTMNDFLEGVLYNSVYRYGYVNSTATVGNIIISSTTTGIQGVASGNLLNAGFAVPTGWNLLVNVSGFTGTAAGNNGIKKVTASTSTSLSIANLTAVSTANMPGAGSNAGEVVVELIGYEQTATAAVTDVNSGVIEIEGFKLASTSKLRVGSWVYIGGATDASKFRKTVSSVTTYYAGYGRISAIDTTSSTGSITLDVSSEAFPDACTSVAGLQIYVPTRTYRNGTDSKPFYFQFERELGKKPGSTNDQAEYVEGAICNELSIAIPQSEVAKSSVAFVATDSATKDDGKKAGTRVPLVNERTFNTASALKHMTLYKHGTASAKTPLFTYLTDLTISISNNLTPVPAIGVVGAIDVAPGEFTVSASMTAIFNDITAVQAARDNADVGLYLVMARAKQGFVVDIPLTRLGTASLSVAQGEPITTSLESEAGRNENNYTIEIDFFDYLPE